MSPFTPEGILRHLLLALVLASGQALSAEEFDLTGGIPGFGDRSTEKSLLDEISRIESRDGAYSADLPEQMLSLGLALQQQDRHGEAIEVFKRGVHLARINNGLYCAEQVPLLEGEIKSSIALGEYARVDELQGYMYRVQLRGLEGGDDRAAALIKQANWQFNAYQLNLGSQGADRLVNMWDLYRLAWTDIEAVHGDTSPLLLPPLYGLFRTQYLISEYRVENELPGGSFNTTMMNAKANRFYSYRSENYELGKGVALAIYKIQFNEHGQDSEQAIDALTAVGDWALWGGKFDEAMEIYQLALTELAERPDAQEQEQRLFGEPVPLPDLKGLRTLPPTVSAEEGNILLEFGVDSRGEVVDLERLDSNEDLDSAAQRLMRTLRNTHFRPRLEAGIPVGTDKLVRAYDIKP